jgi:hypothetical protein
MFEVSLKKGEMIEATLAIRREIPEPPDNLVESVQVNSPSGIRSNKLALSIGSASDGINRLEWLEHPFGWSGHCALRTGTWKLRNGQLFDLSNDISESTIWLRINRIN